MTDGHVSPEGHVDGCRDGLIHGWARWPDGRPARVAVELVVDGTVAGQALAVHHRGDLAAVGLGDAACGFALAADAAFLDAWPGGAFEAELRVQGGATLPGGTLTLDESQLQAAANDAAVWPPLLWRIETAEAEGYIDGFGPAGISGWIHRPADPSPPVLLDIREAGALVATITANVWRPDLAASRQGDGRWGFQAGMPPSLADGRWHILEIGLQGGLPALPGPVHVRLPPAQNAPRMAPPATAEPRLPSKRRPLRTDAPSGPMFSIIVNFYNMQREAGRTLASLTRAYQRGIGDLAYEVLCIDNGSEPPLDEAWIASFGPEFRLIRPQRLLPSPCAAINEAAAQASGRVLAIMIDGAHILTPGVLREAWDALAEAPEAVVALRQWFVGGDQRWLAEAGYTTAQEDFLFDRIAWPENGYDLFTIGMPVWESPSHWLDDVGESNCLFIPAAIWRAIGGIDEGFDEAGAGFANLDLFGRAAAVGPEPVVVLIGEATFHQFHGGTTTNAIEALKERRVRIYENRYIQRRGEPYRPTKMRDVRVRGQVPTHHAKMTRQRPLSPIGASITPRIRPSTPAQHFDLGAQDYANSAYVECALHTKTAWLGRKLGLAPSDVLAVQEIVFGSRPERIVAVNAAPGLLWFLHHLIGLIDGLSCRLVTVSAGAATDLPPAVLQVDGDPASPAAFAGVAHALGAAERVMVIFAPNPGDGTPFAMLRAYAAFVSPRAYLIFLGTAFGQPWLGYSTNWFASAVGRLVAEAPFAIDANANPHLISTSPMGYLQRIGDQAGMA